MKRIAVRLPDATYDRLKALADRSGRTATFYIREAIERHLENLEDLHAAEKAATKRLETGGSTLSLDDLVDYLARLSHPPPRHATLPPRDRPEGGPPWRRPRSMPLRKRPESGSRRRASSAAPR